MDNAINPSNPKSIPAEIWDKIANDIFEIVAVVNRDGNIAYLNHTLESLNPESVIGKSVTYFVEPANKADLLSRVESAFSSNKASAHKSIGFGEMGRPAEYFSKFIPVSFNGKDVDFVVIAATNLTELDKLAGRK